MFVMSLELPNLRDGRICLINGDFENSNVKVLCSQMNICMLTQKPCIVSSQAHSWDMDLNVGSDNIGECFARLFFPVPVGITVGNFKKLSRDIEWEAREITRSRSCGEDGGSGWL